MSLSKIDALLIRRKFIPSFSPFARPNDEELGLLSIATFCEKKGCRVRVLNEQNVTLDLLNSIIKVDKISLFGFYVDADNVWGTISAINELKNTNSDLICVVGGPQASSVPWDEKILTDSNCDFVVRGEGEKTFLNIFNFLDSGQPAVNDIAGISYLDKGTLRRNPDVKPLASNEFPIIDRALTYFPSVPTGIEKLYTSKGCPYHCAFCFEGIHGFGYRMRPVQDIKKEIRYLLKSRQMRYLAILDNLFTVNEERVLAVCREFKKLQKQYRDFVWYCEGRANVIRQNPQIVKTMVDAGLIRLQIGIETGNEDILKIYNKAITLDDIRETVKVCFKEGLLSLVGNFIIGGPFETEETVNQSLSFAKELLELAPGCVDISSSIYAPYPSTKMCLEPEQFGIEILDKDCITGSSLDYVFSRTKDLSRGDLLRLRAEFNQEVNAKASSLLCSISEKRIIGQLNAYVSFGLNTMWVKLLLKKKNYSNYFGLQTTNAMKEFKDVIDEVDEYKPLRTIPVRHIQDDQISLELDDGTSIKLSKMSSRIYEFSSGKITAKQIVNILYRENNEEIDKEVLKEYLMNFFEMLDKEKLVIFTKN